jgi:two-component system response regulator YesN
VNKVMVIDDNALIRKAIRCSINWEDMGCEVVGEASDGIEGIKNILAYEPDIIITDIKMPGIDGLDMIQTIRTSLPNSKVIVISGYAEFEYAQKAIKTGVFDFIVKPIDDEQLIKSIRRAVGEQDLYREKNKQIANIETEKEKLADLVNDAIPLLRQNFLHQLIKGEFQDEVKIHEAADGLGIESEVFEMLLIRSKQRKEQAADWVTRMKELAVIRHVSIMDSFLEDIHVLVFYTSDPQSKKEFSGIVGKIYDVLKSELPPHQGANSALFYDLAELTVIYQGMMQKLSEESCSSLEEATSQYSLLTKNVLKYVSDRIKDDLTLSNTAAVFEISPGYLSSLIKKDTGETFTELVNRGKIQMAKGLLIDPRCRIGEVGNMLGFKDYVYFYQVFKKYVGCSPKEYQKNYNIPLKYI